MSKEVDWTDYELTEPPSNGDEVQNWQNQVLLILLKKIEALETKYAACPVTKLRRAWPLLVGAVLVLGGLVGWALDTLLKVGFD